MVGCQTWTIFLQRSHQRLSSSSSSRFSRAMNQVRCMLTDTCAVIHRTQLAPCSQNLSSRASSTLRSQEISSYTATRCIAPSFTGYQKTSTLHPFSLLDTTMYWQLAACPKPIVSRVSGLAGSPAATQTSSNAARLSETTQPSRSATSTNV